MSGERHSEGLQQVYAAATTSELADAYASWSSTYDRETVASGYCLPFIIAAWISRYVPAQAGPLLDAGCGTGLTGPYLRALGYGEVDGLDFSREMLAIAQSRDVYHVLTEAALGGPLPWGDGYFAAVFSTGVFTEGHAPASSLDELVRITRRGGHVIFTVRDVVLDRDGFRATFAELQKARRWRMLEESPSFRAFAVDEADVLVKAFVFQAL